MSRVAWDASIARQIIAHHDAKPEKLVQILNDFLKRFGYVADEAVALLAGTLNLSRADVHGVISYYHDFRRKPPGRHVLKICQAEACRATGTVELTAEAERLSGLKLGESSDALSLEPVYCLGNCALGPAAMLDGRPIGRVDRARLEELLAGIEEAVS